MEKEVLVNFRIVINYQIWSFLLDNAPNYINGWIIQKRTNRKKTNFSHAHVLTFFRVFNKCFPLIHMSDDNGMCDHHNTQQKMRM